MVIMDSFIWLHVPKVAGTGIRNQLKALGGHSVEGFIEHKGRKVRAAHMIPEEIREIIHEDQLRRPTLAFCRHPMSRFRSICSFMNVSPDYVIDRLKTEDHWYNFEARMMLPQVAYAFADTNWIRLEEVEGKTIDIEGIQIDLSHRENVSPSELVNLTAEHEAFVKEYYAPDFEKFKYG